MREGLGVSVGTGTAVAPAVVGTTTAGVEVAGVQAARIMVTATSRPTTIDKRFRDIVFLLRINRLVKIWVNDWNTDNNMRLFPRITSFAEKDLVLGF
jgi:hypothetical protein